MSQRYLALAAVVVPLLVAGAGCSTATDPTPTPTPSGTNASVTVENVGEGPFDAEVVLLSGRLTRLTVVETDGGTRQLDNLSAVRGVYAFARSNVSNLRLPDGAEERDRVRFQMIPGDSAETTLSAPETETTALVVIRQNDRVVAWATVYCGPENTLRRLEIRASVENRGRFNGVGLQCSPA